VTWLLWRGRENALEDHGLDHLRDSADVVVDLIRTRGRDVVYVDIDPVDMAFIECAERIERSWRETFPEEAHLGHAAFGKWCFFWFSADLRRIFDLVRENDADALRAAATDYIDAEFGWLRGPSLDEPAPSRVPAAFLERA
jgi:hypothetical protein